MSPVPVSCRLIADQCDANCEDVSVERVSLYLSIYVGEGVGRHNVRSLA